MLRLRVDKTKSGKFGRDCAKGPINGGERGIRTPGTALQPYDGLANRCLKPLGQHSVFLVHVVYELYLV